MDIQKNTMDMVNATIGLATMAPPNRAVDAQPPPPPSPAQTSLSPSAPIRKPRPRREFTFFTSEDPNAPTAAPPTLVFPNPSSTSTTSMTAATPVPPAVAIPQTPVPPPASFTGMSRSQLISLVAVLLVTSVLCSFLVAATAMKQGSGGAGMAGGGFGMVNGMGGVQF